VVDERESVAVPGTRFPAGLQRSMCHVADVSRETSRSSSSATVVMPWNAEIVCVMGASPRFSFLIAPAAGKLLSVGRERRCHVGILVLQRRKLRSVDWRLSVSVGGGSFA
jgi:hypothetical protein